MDWVALLGGPPAWGLPEDATQNIAASRRGAARPAADLADRAWAG